MVSKLVKKGHAPIFTGVRSLAGTSRGFLLPVVIALGLGISTVSVLALQTVAQNSKTLNTQYYNAVAREAAKAGIASAAKCLDKANTPDWTAPLVSLDCSGGGTALKVVAADSYDSTFSVSLPDRTAVGSGTILLTSTGTVKVKGPRGTPVSTITETVRTYSKTTTTTSPRTSKNISQISVNQNTTCAVTNDDTANDHWVYCWGDNTNGQLGTGKYTTGNAILTPTAVSSSTVAVSDPGYSYFTCAGTGGCRYEYDPPASSSTPSQMINADGSRKYVTKVSVGTDHSCAIAKDTAIDPISKVYCWGKNDSGQLGDRTNTNNLVPTAVDMTGTGSALVGKSVVDISAGTGFTCVVTSDAKTACWGLNANGQLGIGNTTNSNYPVAVTIPGTITKLSKVESGATMCAINSTGAAYCWGENNVGQAGNNTHSANSSTSDVGPKSSPSGGNGQCTGKSGTGSGNGTFGQPTNSSPMLSPSLVTGGLTFSDITVDGDYVTAKISSTSPTDPNRAYWWGGNETYAYTKTCARSICGSNGSGNQWCSRVTSNYTLTYYSNPPTGPLYSAAPINGSQFSKISGNGYNDNFCGITGGTIYCDTHNSTGYANGQYGSGSTAACSTVCLPVTTDQSLSPPSWLTSSMNIVDMDSGNGHTCIVASASATTTAIGCWGQNSLGQLGTTDTTNRFSPTAVDFGSTSDLGTTSTTVIDDVSNFVYF